MGKESNLRKLMFERGSSSFMKYMMDTNICIFILRNKIPEKLRQKLITVKLSEIAISTITLAELELGVQKSHHPEKAEAKLQLFLSPFSVLPFDAKDALVYAKVRADLEQHGTPIGPLDTFIGSHALSNNLTIITNNLNEFCRIKTLKVEDWSR